MNLTQMFQAYSNEILASVNECLTSSKVNELLEFETYVFGIPVFLEMTPLMVASYYGNYDLCKQLIEKGANVNTEIQYTTALRIAIGHGHTKICELLIEKGAEINYCGREESSLMFASAQGRREICELLIENGADLDAESRFEDTALRSASSRRRKEVCELLIEKGVKFEEEAFHIMRKNDWSELCLKYLNISAFNRRKHLLAAFDSYV